MKLHINGIYRRWEFIKARRKTFELTPSLDDGVFAFFFLEQNRVLLLFLLKFVFYKFPPRVRRMMGEER